MGGVQSCVPDMQLCVCADPEEQEPDEDLMAVPDIPGENPDQSQHEAAKGDDALNRRGSVTLNLSEVDAQTLRDFEVSCPYNLGLPSFQRMNGSAVGAPLRIANHVSWLGTGSLSQP